MGSEVERPEAAPARMTAGAQGSGRPSLPAPSTSLGPIADQAGFQRGGRDSNAQMEGRSGAKTGQFGTEGEGATGADRRPPFASVPAVGRFGTNHKVLGGEGDGDGDGRFALGDVVEPALARALVLAAEAGRWELVERIAGELSQRRVTRGREPLATQHLGVRAPIARGLGTRVWPPCSRATARGLCSSAGRQSGGAGACPPRSIAGRPSCATFAERVAPRACRESPRIPRRPWLRRSSTLAARCRPIASRIRLVGAHRSNRIRLEYMRGRRPPRPSCDRRANG